MMFLELKFKIFVLFNMSDYPRHQVLSDGLAIYADPQFLIYICPVTY